MSCRTIVSDGKRKYEVEGTLGKGTTGSVYRGKRRGKPTTALKLLPAAHRQNAYAEVAALERLSGHKNIVTLHYCGLDSRTKMWFLDLEYAKGGDLLSRVSQRPLTEEEAKPLAFDVLSALAYAHEKGFCHRDLKLENILLVDEKSSAAVLADWGLSTQMKPKEKLSKDCGSLHYACPEILSSRAYYGSSADMWSFGILLFAMVTGCFPYVGSTARQRLTDILTRSSIPFPEETSPGLHDLVMKLLAINESNRVSAADALNHSWFDDLFPAPAMDDDSLALSSSSVPLPISNSHCYNASSSANSPSAFSTSPAALLRRLSQFKT